MHKVPKTMLCAAVCACLAASVVLSGCASPVAPSASSSTSVENRAEEIGREIADMEIDVQTWKAFAANSTAAVFNNPESARADAAFNNACFSPASLYFALALAAEGADGQAQQQLLELMGVEDADDLASFCSTWMNKLEDPYGQNVFAGDDASDVADGVLDGEGADDADRVEIANSIWANEGYAFTPEYLDIVENKLDASAFNAAFGTAAANAQLTEWISAETEGLLQPEFNTSSEDVAKLINTVYFKSAWADQFDSAATEESTFHASSGDTLAPFMHASLDTAGYAQGGAFTASQLGFSNGYTMSFFLPNDGIVAADLLAETDSIQQLLDTQFELRPVDIALPKFTIDSSFDNLIAALRSLGVRDIFDPSNAGMFSTMIDSANGDFYISDAIQETHLGLDEEGVEAAAYTALGVKAMGMLPEDEPIQFVLDRPFVYTIQSPDGVVLFIGAVNAVAA